MQSHIIKLPVAFPWSTKSFYTKSFPDTGEMFVANLTRLLMLTVPEPSIEEGLPTVCSWVKFIQKQTIVKYWQLNLTIGPLHDPVTWYKIIYTGEQIAQWDFQNKGRCIVLEVPLCNMLTSIYNLVPCDRVVQRAYFSCFHSRHSFSHCGETTRIVSLKVKIAYVGTYLLFARE